MPPIALPEPGRDDVLYIVDLSSYVFRAYFAIGHLSSSSGEPTGAVLGVTRMLQKLWTDRRPAHLAVALDSKTPTWRKTAYEPYKANRPSPPPDLVRQFPLVEEIVEAYRVPALGRDGFEADDVIATATRLARAAGLVTVIVTGDKDLMQLVGDRVVVYDTMKDRVYGPEEVEARHGVPPALLGDLLALTGDSSDNVPGVPKVGPKTAAKLLAEHGSLEAVLAAAPGIPGKLGERLVEHAEDARLSRRLVALAEDVELDLDLERLRFGEPDLPRLRAVLERLELRSILAELEEPEGEQGGSPAEPRRYSRIDTVEGLEGALEAIRRAGEVSVDLETTSLDPVSAEIVGVALSWKPLEGWYVPVAHRYLGAPEQLRLEDVLERLRPVLEDRAVRVYGQNFKYDDVILRRHGVMVANVAFDTMMASYLLDPGKRTHNLDRLAAEVLGYRTTTYDEITEKRRGSQLAFDEVELEAATRYAAEDAEVVLALVRKMEPLVREGGLEPLLAEVELPLGRVLAAMELHGVLVERSQLDRLAVETRARLAELEEQARAAAGRPFNVGSPRQLEQILFDELGLPEVKKTKGRTSRSTDVEVLAELAPLHELPRVVLEHRGLAKLLGTYLEGLPRLIHPRTGRIHTSYNQAVAATGRLSSSEPNLQNIPIRTELGRRIREAFVAPPGHRLLAADYSQVELRVLAHLSRDPLLVESFERGEDVHARTAREIFGVGADEEVTAEQRRRAKAINFGVVYGKTDYGLAKELGIGRKEATEFIEGYFTRYAGVKTFMDRTIEAARAGEGVTTMLGRRRLLPEIGARSYTTRSAAERMARNTPIQGSAADIMKVAMVRLSRRLEEARHGARMILTVHDELVLEVPEGEEAELEALVVEVMAGAAELRVPLVVDVGWGRSWAEAH